VNPAGAEQASFLQVAEQAAEAAGAVIRPLFRSKLLVEAKGDASPVTEADRAAERAMRDLIAANFPHHGILGEEYGSERAEAEWLWVLDPIDGTRAFLTGRPLFGTLIALLRHGVPVLGIIDQPVTGERWTGVVGRPTMFVSPMGGIPRCRPCSSLAEAELSCTAPDLFAFGDDGRFERLRRAARRVTWGGDCYGYGLVALGLVDVVAESGLKTWDWAALVPVIEGAGGSVTDWSGAPLRLGALGHVLALGDAALLAEAVGLLAAQD
jgi:histidinol phosphatase-like enzyme (inositol monophosphatase family)